MRTTDADLLAAQKSASVRPYVKVLIRDRLADVRRLRFSPLYSGAEPDGPHAMAVTGDGSILRHRYDPGAGLNYRQRVTDPIQGSQWSSWTSEGAANALPKAIALSSYGATALLAGINNSDALRWRQSTDNGASWGAYSTIATLTSPASACACAQTPSWEVVFYAEGGVLKARRRSGGAWGAALAHGTTLASITGIAAWYDGADILVVVTGATFTNNVLRRALFGLGGQQSLDSWGAYGDIESRPTADDAAYKAPFGGQVDVHRLWYVESRAGPESYNRQLATYLPAGDGIDKLHWHEPYPFDDLSTVGLSFAATSTHAYVERPSKVWRASRTVGDIDVTADVLGLLVDERTFDGSLELVLDNSRGTYTSPSSGALEALRHLSQVEVHPGYRTPAGAKSTSPPLVYHVASWQHETSAGGAALRIRARDAALLLENYHPRYQRSFSATSVKELVAFLLGRAGIAYSTVNESTGLSEQPSFTVDPPGPWQRPPVVFPEDLRDILDDRVGKTYPRWPSPPALLPPPFVEFVPEQNGLRYVRDLLDKVQDVPRPNGAALQTLYPQAADASGYAYGGGGGHPILFAAYGSVPLPYNAVQVTGTGVITYDIDLASIADIYVVQTLIQDSTPSTITKAHERAKALTRRAEMRDAGELHALPNVFLQPWDVVDITDSAVGLTAAKRRIGALTWLYQPARSLYLQTMRLLLP